MPLPSLQEMAQRYAEMAQRRHTALQAELRDAQAKVAEIELERDAAGRATKRLAEFRTRFQGEDQCPCCWIMHEVRSPIRPVDSPTQQDRFQCVTCRETYYVPR